MSIFDMFKKRPEARAAQGGLSRTWSQAPRSETTRLPQLYHQSPRLDPVELIASTIAGSKLELFDKAKYENDHENAEPVKAHPFYELMEAPTRMFPEIDGYSLVYLTAVLVELLGEAFWMKIRAGRRVDELLPIPPSWCVSTPTTGNPRFLFQPFGMTAGRTLTVAPDDVVWFKQIDMTDPYGRGRGRTEAVGGELDTDEMAEKWQKNFFYNDATPPFWANIPGAQQHDLERLKDTWGQRLGGWLNSRKPAFTNADNVTITKIGDSAKDMDFIESRRFLRDVFLQHYAIPPEMLGVLENSNRSTIDSAYYLYSKNVIKKRLGFYERAITKQLIAPDYDDRLIVKFDFSVPEDESFKLSVVNAGFTNGALTRADWKKAMGYKVDPEDDVYLLPYSVIEVPKGKTVADMKPPAQDSQGAGQQEAEPQEDEVIDIIDNPKASKDIRRAMHWKAFDNKAKGGEGLFKTKTKAFAANQSKMVKRELSRVKPEEYLLAIDRAFRGSDEALMHQYAPAWIASMAEGAELGRQYMGMKISPSFELYNKIFDRWVQVEGLKKAIEINATSYDWLRKALDKELAAGIAAGESIEHISQRMLDATDGVYDNMSAARAELIARTETTASVNFGQQVVYRSEGVEKKEWLATMDGAVRDSHIKMDHKVVGIDENFDVPPGDDGAPGEKMPYPGGGHVAAQNCRCRCTLLPVIEL